MHPDHVIPWKLKGNVHWGSGPDVVGQEEMLEDGGGVGPGEKTNVYCRTVIVMPCLNV